MDGVQAMIGGLRAGVTVETERYHLGAVESASMEPRIQYALAQDGVSIACWVAGVGPPLIILMPPGRSHMQLEWTVPALRHWFERQSRGHTLVRYDMRGTGLSDRCTGAIALDEVVADLDAVIERLGLERVVLLAPTTTGPLALSYALARPDRVSRLILWCSSARGSDLLDSPRVQALESLRDVDWDLYVQTMARTVSGWANDEDAVPFAVMSRESTTPATRSEYVKLVASLDLTPRLAEIEQPVLVCHPSHYDGLDVSAARRLVARLRGAQLVLIDCATRLPAGPAWDALNDATDEFLGIATGEEGTLRAPDSEPEAAGTADADERADAGPQGANEPGLRLLLFTDVEGHAEMERQLGRAMVAEFLEEHELTTREIVRLHGAGEASALGDGLMAWFASAQRALECAIAIEKNFHDRFLRTLGDGRARVRVGISAGEPLADEHDIFAPQVVAAVRIAGHAKGGEILVTNVVRELAAGKGFLFADRGMAEVRGFDEGMQLFELRWR